MQYPLESHAHYCVMQGVSFLCYGGSTRGLTYHMNWIDLLDDERIVLSDTREDAANHKMRWIKQLRNSGAKVRNNVYRVVRVQFYWNEAIRRWKK